METFSADRLQYLVLLGLSILIFGFVVILYAIDPTIFQRFIGKLNPLIAYVIVIGLGFVLLPFLLHRNWFAIYEPENLKGLLQFSLLAALLGIIMILVDTKIKFPADMNIYFPESLLFYPAIAYLVDIIFHVLPLTVLLVILHSIFKHANFATLVWMCFVIVALIEPVYQTAFMASENQYPGWAVVYIGIHIFVINIVQLFIFKKYDFISMYSFRLVYYFFWHIGWGYLRLQLLF